MTPQLLTPIALAIIPSIYLQFSSDMSAGDLLVGIPTAFLAIATFSLVWVEINANRKERERVRLKERLEGLYSPLMGLGDDFVKPEEHNMTSVGPVYRTMFKIRSVYSYLASSAIKELLDNYFKKYYVSTNRPDPNLLKNLRILFTAEFEELAKEYRQLAVSETEEKRRAEIAKASSEMQLPK